MTGMFTKSLVMFRNGIAIAAMLLLSAVALAAQGEKPGPAVNQNAAVAAEFDQHVANYMKVHQKALTGLTVPKNTESPDKIAEFQRQLAANIRSLRSDAKQGDIFTQEITALFRDLVAMAMRSSDGPRIRASFEHAEPIHGIRLDVNQAYPDGLPLQSMPPSLLLNLPRLPKELEYRFVGRELILRDIPANLIVDVIPDLTEPQKK